MSPGTTISDPVISSLRCKICSKTYSSFNTLRRHERLIHAERRVHDMKSRIRIKATDNGTVPMDSPLRCSYCQKIFNCSSKRYKHERTIHTGVEKITATSKYSLDYITFGVTRPSRHLNLRRANCRGAGMLCVEQIPYSLD